MKKVTFLLVFLGSFYCLFAQADKSQFLYTSDGKLIGNKESLIRDCADEMDERGMTEEDKVGVCECVLQEMAGHLTYKEFNKMVNNDDFDFEKLFKDKKHKEMANGVIQCVFSAMQGGSSMFREEFLTECISGFEKEPDLAFVNIDAKSYCNCMLDKIMESGELMDLIDEIDNNKKDSPLLTKIAVACLVESMGSDDDEVAKDSVSITEIDTNGFEESLVEVVEAPKPKEKSKDILGDIVSTEVQLTRYLSTYTLKVKVGTVEERFILDSGAGDVLIDKEFEKKLIDAGIITKADEVGEKIYALADGSKVKAKIYVLNEIQVGGFTVNNVVAGVINEKASLLLGKSFLDKFTRWNIDNEKKTLYLEK